MARTLSTRATGGVNGHRVVSHDVSRGYILCDFVGSRGERYDTKLDGFETSCTCPGFRFRTKCKHVPSARMMLAYLSRRDVAIPVERVAWRQPVHEWVAA